MKKLNEKQYDQVKDLLARNSYKTIARKMEIGNGTINQIKNSKSYEEYRSGAKEIIKNFTVVFPEPKIDNSIWGDVFSIAGIIMIIFLFFKLLTA